MKAQNVKINKHAKLIRCLIGGVSSLFLYFKLKLRTKLKSINSRATEIGH